MTAVLEHQLEAPDIFSAFRAPSPAAFPPIALTAEQKGILDKPLHPRVDRILQELHSDRAAAENALKARRIIQFPIGNSSEAHVEQGDDGFWRIIPGPPLRAKISVGESL